MERSLLDARESAYNDLNIALHEGTEPALYRLYYETVTTFLEVHRQISEMRERVAAIQLLKAQEAELADKKMPELQSRSEFRK